MLDKILSPFTTATSAGVAVRYIGVIISTILTVLGVLNLLPTEQVEELKAMIPDFIAALTAVITALITGYAIVTKSSSDKAAEVAKQVDAKIPVSDSVVIQTPGKGANITVDVKPDGTVKK